MKKFIFLVLLLFTLSAVEAKDLSPPMGQAGQTVLPMYPNQAGVPDVAATLLAVNSKVQALPGAVIESPLDGINGGYNYQQAALISNNLPWQMQSRVYVNSQGSVKASEVFFLGAEVETILKNPMNSKQSLVV